MMNRGYAEFQTIQCRLQKKNFFDNFEPENCSERTSDTYYEYSATLDGVKFMCLSARDIKAGAEK